MIPLSDSIFRERRHRLAERLALLRLRSALISKPTDILYLTGFRGSAGALLVGPKRARLWVDPRYTLQAREQARGVEVVETRAPLAQAVGAWLRRAHPAFLGYQEGYLTCGELARLRHEAGRRSRVRWRPLGALLDELRMVKDAAEIERMRQVGRLTADVFREVLPMVKPGACELDLAAELEYRLKRAGAEAPAFETIVASGPRSAWPHARASARRLGPNELVIVDLGAILGAYAADMTRTLYLGVPTRRARQLYESVAEAQQETILSLRAGVGGEEADSVARRVLARRKLEGYFTHSTGHGVGLEVHEKPRLARGERTLLEPGMVVTVEPGVYLEGYGGVRIEDTVLVQEHGPEVLTPAPKQPWFTG
jgi:Xaa-Pro aminopeptidase